MQKIRAAVEKRASHRRADTADAVRIIAPGFSTAIISQASGAASARGVVRSKIQGVVGRSRRDRDDESVFKRSMPLTRTISLRKSSCCAGRSSNHQPRHGAPGAARRKEDNDDLRRLVVYDRRRKARASS